MRLFCLEIKRVIKTPATSILFLTALVLSAVLAYIPVTFQDISYEDAKGNSVALSGPEAVEFIKEKQRDITGNVTPQMLRKALEEAQACMGQHKVRELYELPKLVYMEKILPIEPLLQSIREVYTHEVTGIRPSLMDISPQQAEDFYNAAPKRLAAQMKIEQGPYPAAQEAAAKLYSRVEKPFTFYPGQNFGVMEYQTMLIFLVVIFCGVIAAPVFAGEYQTGADDILRCTKHGRGRLGAVKILSALSISSLTFILCLSLYTVISNSLFGWECTKTSLQMMVSATNLPPLNMGQLLGLVALASGVSLLAVISAVLWISAKCKNTLSALTISLLILLLPLILYFALPSKIEPFFRALLPSGGIGLQNSHLFALWNYHFISIGSFSLWLPHAMLAMAAIEIPLFIFLAFSAYTRRHLSQ